MSVTVVQLTMLVVPWVNSGSDAIVGAGGGLASWVDATIEDQVLSWRRPSRARTW